MLLKRLIMRCNMMRRVASALHEIPKTFEILHSSAFPELHAEIRIQFQMIQTRSPHFIYPPRTAFLTTGTRPRQSILNPSPLKLNSLTLRIPLSPILQILQVLSQLLILHPLHRITLRLHRRITRAQLRRQI